MCVIIVKPAGVKLPSHSFLRAAAEVNHDGCGYVTSDEHYYRSLSFSTFWRDFSRHAREDEDIIIHFRWATHGSVRVSNCHPFAGEYDGHRVWFAHNGVLPIESVNNKTDSEIFFRDIALPWLRYHHGFAPRVSKWMNLAVQGSRFAFLDESGLHLYGDFVKHNGLLLSNTRFLRPVISTRGITDKLWGTGL